MTKRWLSIALRWAFIGGLLFLAFLAVLWVEHRTPLELPAPTGPFAVGRVTTTWADSTRADPFAPAAGQKRELVVWIWYPAVIGRSSAAPDEYVPAPLRAELERARGPLIGGLLTRDVSRVRSHSVRDAAVSPQQRSYPVVIMRGGASSEVVNYTTLAEDLASHGYFVVGFDAPYRTNVVVLPDGRVTRRRPENNPELCSGKDQDPCIMRLLEGWTADVAFALDRLQQLDASDAHGRFTGRLDLTRVGVFGHSFGGATAAQFCHDDPRCKAGIDLDGAPFGSVIRNGLHQPFLFVLSDHGDTSDPESRRILGNIQSIYDRLPVDSRLRIGIRGANHFLFSDDGALLKSHIVMRALRLLGIVRIDGRRQLAVTAYCVHNFFDAYLKRETPSRPPIPNALYPEIQAAP